MIVQMKKVSLVVLKESRRESLKQLRKLGLVHLEELEGKSQELAEYRESYSKIDKALGLLSDVKVSKKDKKLAQVDIDSKEKAVEVAEKIISLCEQKKSYIDSIAANVSELERFMSWGSVDPKDFTYFAEKGLFIYLFEIPSDKYSLIPESLNTIVVNENKNITRFILFNFNEPVTDRPASMPPEAYAVPLPENSTDEIVKLIEKSKKNIVSVDENLKKMLGYRDALKKQQKLIAADISFENVYSGMESDADSEDKEAYLQGNSLAWLTGYVPVDGVEAFEKACKENQWAYIIQDPSDDDPVPTKLKNNKLVSLIYPLTDFLGTVPGYHEYDISGWFLLFFTIFFGIIFGDGGYGLLIVLLSLVLMLKNAFTRKPFSPLTGLMLILGLATVGWGVITCTWFGISADTLTKMGLGFLPKISVPIFSNAYSEIAPGVDRFWRLPWSLPGEGLTTSECVRVLCFTLALVQLSVAHIKSIIRHRKSLKVLGDIGNLMQLWGMFWIVLMIVVSMKEFSMKAVMVFGVIPIGYIFLAVLGIGFVLSFIFSNYEGSVKESVLASLKGIISVLLGVVNVFSDIASYIRLWAVGLAGSAISSTVNSMASQIAGAAAGPVIAHALIFLCVVCLLLFGHGLNLILNLLSVIVHGVRLNTLEFTTHLGMEWSGFKYEPFSEN